MMRAIRNLLSSDIGMDLGTANTLVYLKEKGVLFSEPSVVALDRDSRRVLAVGSEAKRMLGRTPSRIIAVRPLKNGVIADFRVTQDMIQYFMRRAMVLRSLLRPRVVIGVPSGITEVERRAVKESAEQAGAREVRLIEEPMAAAIGADLPVAEARGSMIVDVGGGTTEVAVIALGGMVVSKSVDTAGDEMDEALIQHFRRRHNLVIGESTAEAVKMNLGSVFPVGEESVMEVKGRDQGTGLPKMVVVSSKEVREPMLEQARVILDIIRSALEETPAELAADLVDRGMVLAGGGSLLRGLPELIADETHLPVRRAKSPLTCVVEGVGKYMEYLDRMNGDSTPLWSWRRNGHH